MDPQSISFSASPYPTPGRNEPRPRPENSEFLQTTKFLTLVLRDDPKSIGLRLDANGWAEVGDLLKRAKRNGLKLTRENLGDVLNVSENHRFEWDHFGDRIRWGKS